MTDLLLYGFPLSANVHRVRLMLSLLDLTFEERTINLSQGEQFSVEFTAINPQQRIPVLIHNDQVFTESCAILLYLAEQLSFDEREHWWPSDPAERAAVAAWLFYTAGELHNGIGLARNEHSFGIPSGGEFAVKRARTALKRIEKHLQSHDYLALARVTLADIAVYPFVAVAPEASLALDQYPAIQGWIKRLATLPRFTPMPMLSAVPLIER